MTAAQTPSAVRDELFGPSRRATTIGIVLLISLIAFEAMGVNTAMPALVADLGGVALYAWPFVSFMAASVFATVLGGRWCDRAGPRVPLVVSPLMFGAGLLVAGTATTMAQLLVGRVLQGAGAGMSSVAIFVLIAAVYPERARPAVFGLISSAWVLPALLGPPVSGLVTQTLSWHWVFLGLVPLVLVATALVVPAVRTLTPPEQGVGAVRRGVVPAAFAASLGVAALSWASQHASVLAAVVAVASVAVLVPALVRLFPRGVFRLGRGIPTVVASRGLLAGVFFTINSYLPLMLEATHGWSLAAAGIPLIVGALAWSGASAWQGRHPDLPRTTLLRVGFCGVTVGAAGMLLVAPSWGIPWLALPFWAIAGLGMGLGFSSVSFLLLQQSEAHETGFHTSAAQIADQLGTAILIGAGGAVLALLGTPAAALPVLIAVLVALGLIGVFGAARAAQPGSANTTTLSE
ncbi:MFS transporter [Pseudonocardia cypriaca]|uniref:Putative MFS family arabinose efflux permease n=1 Tax=Pseudonocardia cypriaca TaxID=882449 RepID=A0A543FXT3_9PSEU|nr:MFS transporter [Pseudonocardia cypriaca]TQM38589.1 putative MFS family arabinose efflux permease [Pseudonocardia cypriaca]